MNCSITLFLRTYTQDKIHTQKKEIETTLHTFPNKVSSPTNTIITDTIKIDIAP